MSEGGKKQETQERRELNSKFVNYRRGEITKEGSSTIFGFRFDRWRLQFIVMRVTLRAIATFRVKFGSDWTDQGL